MQDAIDKRNERDRIAHSIVKRWNVHYMSEEEILAARKKQQDEQQAQKKQMKRFQMISYLLF